MSSTERVFKQFYVKLVKSLPMQNAVFLAELFSAHMLSIDLKRSIKAEKTPEDKAMCFLDDRIYLDISKGDFRSFDALLNIMKKRDFRTLNNLAEKIKVALVVEAAVNPSNTEGDVTEIAVTTYTTGESRMTVASLDSKPEFSDLEQKFENVADWESVCPYLLNDDDGQKTYRIRRGNVNLEGRRDKMLREFLNQPNPTWKDVVQALRAARYNNLADKIEHGLQVPTGTVKALPDVLTTSLDSRPKFPELKRKFETIANWEAVCPYLLNDDDGQKTKKIKIDNADVDGRRTKMLQEFLEQSNPTWRDVVSALRAGRYNNSADQIEHELRG